VILIKEVTNFIKKMRRLIHDNSYTFENRDYDGLDYATILLQDFMITPDEAIDIIRNLNIHSWENDKKPSYSNSGAYVFKRDVNGIKAYIKLKIEENNEGELLVIISFHEDY